MPAMNGGEPHVLPGHGEVLLWIGYYDERQIDRVTVTATAASGSVAAQIQRPLALTWTGQPAPWPTPPQWLQRMNLERERQAKADYGAMMNSPLMAAADTVAVAMMIAVPGYFLLQCLVLWLWGGGWRKAAMAPLWPMGAVLAYTVYTFFDGSNLFPVVLIFTAPLAFLYLLLLLALRGLGRLIGPGSSPAT
jgi:hypothetical protein